MSLENVLGLFIGCHLNIECSSCENRWDMGTVALELISVHRCVSELIKVGWFIGHVPTDHLCPKCYLKQKSPPVTPSVTDEPSTDQGLEG